MPAAPARADLGGLSRAQLAAAQQYARQELESLEAEIARVRNVLVVLISDRHEATVYLRKIIKRLVDGGAPIEPSTRSGAVTPPRDRIETPILDGRPEEWRS